MAYSSIVKPTDYFNTITYAGNGSSPRSITGVGFQPDWVWTKNRSAANSNTVGDSVRGTGKTIFTDSTSAELTNNGYGYHSSFDADGFAVTGDTASAGGDNVNKSGNNYVSWNWLASGSTASNSDGDITSTVSANTTAGFSIVKFTANGTNNGTIGHGLGVAPKVVLYKRTDSTGSWYWLYKYVDGSLDFLQLDSTAAKTDLTLGTYGFTTSTTFTNLGLGNGQEIIAYCFAEKKGYSKIGRYIGNASADGPFVYTGFKPAFVLSKDADGAGENWFIHDNKRNTYNPTNTYLRPNLSNAEGTAHHYDFYSNGFKNKYAGGSLNTSGRTYIYLAFAEEPLVANVGQSIPATAR